MQKAELGKTAGHGCGEGSLRNGLELKLDRSKASARSRPKPAPEP